MTQANPSVVSADIDPCAPLTPLQSLKQDQRSERNARAKCGPKRNRELSAEEANENAPSIGCNWQHGDDPEAHPLWAEQVELEYGMMRAGADKLRDQVITATENRQMTQISVVRNLMTDWLPGVAAEISRWVAHHDEQFRLKGGTLPIILPIMRDLDPYMAALVGLREIMDRIGHNKTANTVQNIAMEIGRTIEYECRIRAWERGSANDKALWRGELKGMERDKVTSGHRRRRLINRFNHHVKECSFDSLEWNKWPLETIFRVGWEVMDAVVRATGWFECIPDPEHVYGKKARQRARLLLAVKPGLTDWLAKALDHAEVNQPDFRPTIMPPKPWTKTRDGGYWTPYAKPPRLVRFRASQENQQDTAADEYDALEMPKVYRAINMLQDTAYVINERVRVVFGKVWTELRWSGVKACLPELNDRELPARTPRMMAHREANRGKRGDDRVKPDPQTEKEIFEWKKQAAPTYAFNGKRASRTKGCSAIWSLATQFAKYEAIYFPHMLDFRGRIYPIPAYLHPQGNDLARGLLTYATEAPITVGNGGIRWLAIHLASNWGHDKLPFDAREKWVYDNEALLRAIAADPYTNNEWFKADKPWQTLAAIYEWVDYLDAALRGETFYSSLPIMVDGTCNGIQHLSAIIRDEVAGQYVNLIPSEEPQDIYKFVARELQEKLEEIAASGGDEGRLAQWWIDLCGGELPRSLTKKQVMVLPYGGTMDSFFTHTRDWLAERLPVEGLSAEERAENSKRVTFLASHMWASVKENIRPAIEVMGWIKGCAKVAAHSNQPIYWTVPSGFVVRHFYGVSKDKKVDLLLDGTRCQVRLGARTADLSLKEQLQGIAPNFIHSLDASCLVDCINLCADANIPAFSSVHDAYGTHAANMDRLAHFLRAAFVRTHEVDALLSLKRACVEVAVDHAVAELDIEPSIALLAVLRDMPKPIKRGELDLNGVMRSAYFFA